MSIKASQEYDKDFYGWVFHNAALIRAGRFHEVDAEHVAEELESMGKSDKRELINRLALLMAHLLKWQYQSVRRSKSWRLTIKEQRIQIRQLLEESPSLKHEIATKLDAAYEQAVVAVEIETALDESTFPARCPFTLDECLDSSFFPDI